MKTDYKNLLAFDTPEIQESVYREFDIYMDSYGSDTKQKLEFSRIKSDYSSMLAYWRDNPDAEGLALLCVSISGLFSGPNLDPDYESFVNDFRSTFKESDAIIFITSKLMSRRTDSEHVEEDESEYRSSWFSSEADFSNGDGDDEDE